MHKLRALLVPAHSESAAENVPEVQELFVEGCMSYEPNEPQSVTQRMELLRILGSGLWFTLEEISAQMRVPHMLTGLSMRLRELRYDRFGSWPVEKMQVSSRLWKYRIKKSAAPLPKSEPVQTSMFEVNA